LLGVARGDRHVATVVVLSGTAIIGDKKQGGAKTTQCNEKRYRAAEAYNFQALSDCHGVESQLSIETA
jgi:hypothetical protein